MACSPRAVATSVAEVKLHAPPSPSPPCSSKLSPPCSSRLMPPLKRISAPRNISPTPIIMETSMTPLKSRSAPASTFCHRLVLLLKIVPTSLTIEEKPVTVSRALTVTLATVWITVLPMLVTVCQAQSHQPLQAGAGGGGGGGTVPETPPPAPPCQVSMRPLGSLAVSGLPLT